MKRQLLYSLMPAWLVLSTCWAAQALRLPALPNHAPILVSPPGYQRIPARTQDCASKSLYAAVLPWRPDLSYATVRERFDQRGGSPTATIADIVAVAEGFGIDATAMEVSFEKLTEVLDQPGRSAILHCGGRHFVAAFTATHRRIAMCDPTIGVEIVNAEILAGMRYRWNGITIVLDESRH